MRVGEILRSAREAKGWSLQDLPKKMGLKPRPSAGSGTPCRTAFIYVKIIA
jgi:transcriptional regulator with XRE-family HTH domain